MDLTAGQDAGGSTGVQREGATGSVDEALCRDCTQKERHRNDPLQKSSGQCDQ